MNKPGTLLLVDVFGLLYRAFFTMPRMTAPDGTPTNAIYGMSRILLKLLNDRKPDFLALAMDPPGGTFREELYSEYKAHRDKMPDDLRKQVPLALELFEAMGLSPALAEGFEADDVIGTLVARSGEAGGLQVEIVTGDRDLLQLVTDEVAVLISRKGVSDLVRYTPQLVKEQYGYAPNQVTDYKGLAGDSSDNIPGVKGVGEKTALKLLDEFGSLEALYEKIDEVQNAKLKEKLENDRENAFLSKKLATISSEAPVSLDLDAFRLGELPRQPMARFFQKLAFNTLLKEMGLEELEEDISAIGDDCETVLISDEKGLKALIGEIEKAGRFVVDLETTGLDVFADEIVGIAVAIRPEKAWYIPIGHRDASKGQGDLFGECDGEAGALVAGQLSPKTALAALKPVLESASIKKAGHNIKFDYMALRNAGIRMAGIDFDTMVGSYLLNPNDRRHGLKQLSLRVLGKSQTSYEEVAGKGKNEVSFSLVPMEEAMKYACGDVEATVRLRQEQEPQLKESGLAPVFEEIELPLIETLAEMELEGIRIDVGYLNELSAQIEARENEVQKTIVEATGMDVNLRSPKQVGELLYGQLGLPRQRKASTDIKALTALRELHPAVDHIMEYRRLTKLRSTYTDALPSLVNPKTGRVHTSFNQTVAATGRLSSSEPNLQNIPIRTEEGKAIRRAFTPSGPGRLLLAADYSQVEIRLLAHLSEDPILIDTFAQGQDVHTRTAAEIFGVRQDEVDKDMRRRAKSINFGIIYGMKEYGLSQDLGIPVSEAARFIQRYYEKYPAIEKFMEETKEQVLKDGFVTTLFGRRRDMPEVFSSNRNDREFGFRAAINARVQGTAADIIKIAMNKIRVELSHGFETRMLLQVHDELVFDAPEDELERAAGRVREIMQTCIEDRVSLKVPLTVDIGAGENWLDIKAYSSFLVSRGMGMS